jgi:peptidylprolyl isomerase
VLTETNARIDSNWGSSSRPIVLGDGTFVPGFEEGLVGAQAGEQLQLDIPGDMAYGDDSVAQASIPEGAPLSYLVNVIAVVPATTEDEAPTDLDLPLSTTPATEVTTDDVVSGEGETWSQGQTGVVNIYAVCATNGAVIQNTWGDDQREFITLSSGAVIDGLVTGLDGMQVGGTRIITVPAANAFADAGSADLEVGPGQDLIFVVELYGIVG